MRNKKFTPIPVWPVEEVMYESPRRMLLPEGFTARIEETEDGTVVELVERPKPIVLPTEPGTVIAVGDWWFVRLRAYETTSQSAWELLPLPTKRLSESAARNGFPQQCGYSSEAVLAEAEQEGGFVIVAAPVSVPGGEEPNQ